MTRKEVILNTIQNMSDWELYTLYDEGYISFRRLGLEEKGPTVCELCRHYRGSCTLPDGVYCSHEVYTAWLNAEVSGDVGTDRGGSAR